MATALFIKEISMRLLILFVAFLSAAAKGECVNLSFKSSLGGASIENRQIGCDRIERTMIFSDGDKLVDPSIVLMDGQWAVDSNDDEYETFTRQIRWSWNPGQTGTRRSD
jgi:hypothetical protein